MDESTIQMIKEKATDWHYDNQKLANSNDIELFENEYGKIHPDYLPYLTDVGFEVVGSGYFDRIDELITNTKRFKENWTVDPDGKIKECFVFHWDGSGNPIGISWNDNKIYVDDHTFGSGKCLGNSIDEYIMGLIDD